ncbi:MAG: replication-relaxation family protein [Bdellovibrio sp.]
MNQENTKERLIITERDISVLYFIFQMRFATSHQIMKACFEERRDGKTRTSDLYIKRRLSQLVKAKLLLVDLPPIGGKQYYLYKISRAGLRVIEAKGISTFVSHPPKLRMQDFNHDSHVNECRIHLEKANRAKDWVPEFQIRTRFNIFEKLPAKYIPDALFINKLGELTALEMEISRKSMTRYEEKIQKYVDLIRSHFDENIKFKRVLFVAKNKDVFTILSEITKIYSDIFRVETFDSLIGTL